MSTQYVNYQREMSLNGIADLVTVEHAAELLAENPVTLDHLLRREGWLVWKIGATRLLRLGDLPNIEQRFREVRAESGKTKRR